MRKCRAQSSILAEPFSSLHQKCVAWILSGWSSLHTPPMLWDPCGRAQRRCRPLVLTMDHEGHYTEAEKLQRETLDIHADCSGFPVDLSCHLSPMWSCFQ